VQRQSCQASGETFRVERASATSHWSLAPQQDSSVISRLGWEAFRAQEHCSGAEECSALLLGERLAVGVAAEGCPLD
jgi:hypothetical protein